MSGTIESIHRRINDKLELIQKYFETIREVAKENPAILNGKLLNININLAEFEILKEKYNLSTIHLLSEYYTTEEIDDTSLTKKFCKTIESENFQSSINDYLQKIKTTVNYLHENIDRIPPNKKGAVSGTIIEIKRGISQELNIDLIDDKKSSNNICKKCGSKMIVLQNMTQLKCDQCSILKTVCGEIMDEQYSDGQKTKHGSYDPNRHFDSWLDKIQAKKQKTFSERDVERIQHYIKSDDYTEETLNCKSMRKILKDAKLTKLNDYVPLLIKTFTNKVPPELTHAERRRFHIRFSKIMKYYRAIKREANEDGNRPYYPYFIYKIAEYEFKDDPIKIKLLDFIHLQSSDTVCKNDLIFEEICERAYNDGEEGFVYIKTNYYD